MGDIALGNKTRPTGSRGCNAFSLKANEMWWKGPVWLSGPQSMWPTPSETVETVEMREELKRSALASAVTQDESSLANVLDINRIRSLHKLLRVTARLLRFIHNVRARKRKQPKIVGNLEAEEIKQAETAWVKTAQVTLKRQTNYEQLVDRLQIVEEEGLLRCMGRLKNSDLDLEGRQPRILPRDHPLTAMIIKACHEQVLHSGLRATLAQVRSRYWIPKGRQAVKTILGKCFVCKKHEGRSFTAPEAASLPEFRVRQSLPFSKVGVDFAGPLYIKEGKETKKVYITLWTCCVTRAVHLDLVRSLTTAHFMRCLNRFTSRRGRPTLIVSDNAKTFKAAAKLVRNMMIN